MPFLGHTPSCVFGFIASFLLIEPSVDTIKFSFKNYLIQTKQGFNQLFQKEGRNYVIKLLLLGGFIVILDEMMEAFLLIEFGFKAQWLGIFYSAVFLFSAFSSQFTPWLKSKFTSSFLLTLTGLIIATSLIISPAAGLIIGGLTVSMRYILAPIFNNLALSQINDTTLSQYRATTISTFNMLKNLPYVLSAFFIGRLMDIISARMFAMYFGLVLILVLVIQHFALYKKKPLL